MNKNMRVEICIEHLSLHGIPAVSAGWLRTSLARELARLIDEGGVPAALATDTHRRRLRSPGPPVPATADARMAQGLALNIYCSLGRLDRPNPIPGAAPPVVPPSPTS